MYRQVIMLNQTKNGDELVRKDADLPYIIVITCMLSLFSVAGTIGNAFVFYVFSRKKDKNTSTVFILALASIDFVTCVLVIPFTIAVEFQYKKIDSDPLCKIYQFLITSNVPFSAFIMVAIAFDRYFCICRPWNKFLNTKCALRVILSLLVFSLTLGLITSLTYGVYHQTVVVTLPNVSSGACLTYNMSDIKPSLQFDSTILATGVSEMALSNCSQAPDSGKMCGSVLERDCQLSDAKTSSDGFMSKTLNISDLVFTGFCYPNEVIVSTEFRKVYQKLYASLFLIAFITVFVLYAMIYRSILSRRSRRLKSTLNNRNLSGRRSTVLTSIFSRTPNCTESFCMVEPTKSDVLSRRPETTGTFCKGISERNNANGQLLPDTDIQTVVSSPSQNACATNDTRSNANVAMDDEHVSLCPSKDGQHKVNIINNDLKVPVDTERYRRTGKLGRLKPRKPDIKQTNVGNGALQCHFEEQTNMNIVVTDLTDVHKSNNMTRKDTRKSVREKHRIANIKTAGILFIVTVVFIVAFLPAWLMATKLIEPNAVVFYSYFIYNVANPVIYAFFNQTFQKEMALVLKCKNHK